MPRALRGDLVSALVLGATGFLGINLVDALLAMGLPFTCARRTRSNVIPLRSRKVPLVVADLDDPESLRGAMRGNRVVYHLAGHYPRHSLNREATLFTGMRQSRNVLAAARAEHIERVVYVSSTATVARGQKRRSKEADVYAAAPGFGVYHDLKWEMEQLFLHDPRSVVLAPGACLGAWDLRVGTSGLLIALARGQNPPHPDGNISIVDARDVARAVIRLGAHAAPPKRLLLAAANYRLHALLQRLSHRYRVPPPTPPIPAAAAIALANQMEVDSRDNGGRVLLPREIVDLVVHGVPVDASLAAEKLDLDYTPLSDTLDHFDSFARRMGLIPPLPNELHP